MLKRLRHKIPKKYLEGKIIFDVGTGPESIEFIKSCNPKKIYAISVSKDIINDLKKQGLYKNIYKFYYNDITDKKFNSRKLKEKVDVIFAGYFFSALEGVRPFKTLDTMEKLKGFLKKDGIIIIEDFYWEEKLKYSQDILCRKLWVFKDGLKTILDIPFPKQMPISYIKELLEMAGYKIIMNVKGKEERVKKEAKLKRYEKQVENTKKYINMFKNPLKSELNKYIDNLLKDIKKIGKPAYFSHDYLIIANQK